jgi:hypothetical protein
MCCHLLACASNDRVFLEHLDDVIIECADGWMLLEQTKSATRQNPAAD